MTVYAEQLSCQDLAALVTDYLEGALSEEETVRFESHIGRCDGCQAYLEQIGQTVALSGRLHVGRAERLTVTPRRRRRRSGRADDRSRQGKERRRARRR